MLLQEPAGSEIVESTPNRKVREPRAACYPPVAVPFFSISGSEFVEMFVGVGAARLREVFDEAKKKSPCIVFIDKLDAIGKSRSSTRGMIVSHDEREQTLKQLLVEMDGFDSRNNVIIMAASNTPEVLDRALLRAGRFEGQVLVDRPDLQGRLAILQVHAKKVRLAVESDLRTIAARTPGMVGADLANVVNEAALLAARRGASHVTGSIDSFSARRNRCAPSHVC